MTFAHRTSWRRPPIIIWTLLFALLWLPARSNAAQPKYGNSLDLIPADAAFYSVSLRLREQFDIIAKSNAWAKLKNLPSVQMAWSLAQLTLNQPSGPGDQINEFFSDPDNKELCDLLIEAVSTEFFVYGDRNAADMVDIGRQTMNAVRYGSMVQAGDESVTARIAMNSLDANRDRLAAPGMIFGFKISDMKRAQNQLTRLEKTLKPILDEEPQLRGRLKRMKVGETEVLTLDLDGSMVPWEEVPWQDLEEKPGQYNALRDKLKSLRISVSLGVQDGYLLLAIGDSPVKMAALGKGKLLAEQTELQPLEKFASKPLVSISYSSKAMLQAMANTNRDLDQMVQVVRQVLPEAGLPDEMNKRIVKDAEELAGDLKGIVPEVGAQMSFSFLVPHGIEGYHYDWAQNLYADGSKPLDLLDHVGGTPLLAIVGRGKYSPQQYEQMRKWIVKAFGYFEELAIPQFSPDEQDHYKKAKAAALPLVERLDKATGQLLLPALKDGQAGLVLDAKLTSKNWFEDLPQGDRSLPMLEAAFVFGVSDAALLKQACAEYRSITESAIEKAKELFPGEVPPDLKLPPVESSDVTSADGAGTIFWYKLPPDVGIDSQLVPNAGLTQHVAVLSLAPKTSERLLGSTPLSVSSTGPLGDRKKPMAAAAYFNWAGLVDAATPWGDLLMGQQGLDQSIVDQVHTVLDILKVFRTAEAATAIDAGATVTHSLTIFQDVP